MLSREVIQTLMVMAELTGKVFTEPAAKLLAQDLERYDTQDVLRALHQCRRELRYFPTLADIEARVSPRLDPQKRSLLIAGYIGEAVAKLGSYTTSDALSAWFDAKDPLCTRVIQLYGGWLNLCEQMTHTQKTSVMAQLRDIAGSLATKETMMLAHDEKPALENKGINLKALLKDMPK